MIISAVTRKYRVLWVCESRKRHLVESGAPGRPYEKTHIDLATKNEKELVSQGQALAN